MRVQEILRALIDYIDAQETQQQLDPEDGKNMVQDMINDPQCTYNTAPNPVYADVEDITTRAGGGPNKPKHPADIRIKDPRGYE